MEDPNGQCATSTRQLPDTEVKDVSGKAMIKNLTDEIIEPSVTEVMDDERSQTASIKLTDNLKKALKKYAKFVGPGLLISVAYVDPGNYSTATSAGSQNQFSMLFIVLLSNILAIFLQCLCIKLGTVTGLDLSRACREYLPRWLNWTIYVFAEGAIIATDVAEVIGTAIALNILIRVPLPAGVAISVVDIILIMLTYRPGYSMKFVRIFEFAVALLVLGVAICFAVELAYIPKTTPARKVFRGFAPSRQMFENNGIYTAISILGATVMPHSLFLGSALVQTRLLEYDVDHGNYIMTDDDKTTDKKQLKDIQEQKYWEYRPTLSAIRYCMKYSMIELIATLFTIALFVNCAILVVAGAILYGTPEAINADLYTVHKLLSRFVAPAAGTIFMLALLLSGQSAGIVCTMAGQVVSEGHINWKLKPWQRRLATRAISLVPCLVISISMGKDALSKALNASQVVLSITLPFLVAPLIYFTCSKKFMKTEIITDDDHFDELDSTLENERNVKQINMANGWIVTIISVVVWIFLSVLNVYALVQLGLSHGDISG